MEVIKTDDIDCWYIDSKEDLDEVVEVFCTKDVLGCDTETNVDLSKIDATALDPHSSKISLIQMSWIDNPYPYIIDVIKIGVEGCKNLIDRVFMNKDIIKVFHNARFDIKQFKSTFGVWIKNVRCTMVLLKTLGISTGFKASQFRGHSLKDMCRDFFGVLLDKTEATSQWGARPLSNSQFGYCALDVGAFKDDLNSNCYLLDAYFNLIDTLDKLGQQIGYEADQYAMFLSARMEYQGVLINQEILNQIRKYAEDKTNLHRDMLVKELGFTIYTDLELDDDGEWISIQVIPDKIKTLLNNNKGLVQYISDYLVKTGAPALSNLQAEEIQNYLGDLEADVEKDNQAFDEEFFNSKYDGISLIKNLLSYKKYSKLLSETDKYFKVINKNTNRVHAGFNAVGTGTGRMSSSGDLNVQQVSSTRVTLELEGELL